MSERTDYATTDALVESLHTLKATYDVPIDQYMRNLVERKVDSISFTKDSPYYYFYARTLGPNIAVTFKKAGTVIEFSLPLQEAEKTLIA